MAFRVNSRVIGDESLYFVADIGANHDGDLGRALQLIELAKEAGADAAKFQNFHADRIVSDSGFRQLGGQLSHQAGWDKSVYEVYDDASLSEDWTVQLKEKCDEVGIDYFTSPYDFESVDHVDPYVDLYKIGSGDITWLEIIQYIGRKGKPVLLATGAADLTDVYRAVAALREVNDRIVLMQCNTNYTTDVDKIRHVNLRVLDLFTSAFPDCVPGLSDHTFGHASVCGAVALGARVIEKHFTDDNSRTGPDHRFAMNPATWRVMVDTAGEVLAAMGDGVKRVEANEHESRVVQQRSLHATADLSAGTVLQREHLAALRPCPPEALPPYCLSRLVGRVLNRPLSEGEQIHWSHVVSSGVEEGT